VDLSNANDNLTNERFDLANLHIEVQPVKKYGNTASMPAGEKNQH